MKWLRDFSTLYIPGIELNGESVSFRHTDLSWDEDYFTIFPLADGELTIKAYAKEGNVPATTSYTPTNDITVYYRSKEGSTWNPLQLSLPSLNNSSPGYTTKTISLIAGTPIELKSSEGLTRIKSGRFGSPTEYTGSIKTDCPAIIMGQLQSLVTGGISTPGNVVEWGTYLSGINEIFSNWTTLIDASNLIMPREYSSQSIVPSYSRLFSGCSSLTSAPMIIKGGNYTECFKNCVSLESIYANLNPLSETYTLTDWVEGTNLGNRVIYVPETLSLDYDLHLENSWTREVFEF